MAWRPHVLAAPSYVYTRRELPELAPVSLPVRAGVALWKRLPRRTADVLGPLVSRFMV
jgi:hypothetical protein